MPASIKKAISWSRWFNKDWRLHQQAFICLSVLRCTITLEYIYIYVSFDYHSLVQIQLAGLPPCEGKQFQSVSWRLPSLDMPISCLHQHPAGVFWFKSIKTTFVNNLAGQDIIHASYTENTDWFSIACQACGLHQMSRFWREVSFQLRLQLRPKRYHVKLQ